MLKSLKIFWWNIKAWVGYWLFQGQSLILFSLILSIIELGYVDRSRIYVPCGAPSIGFTCVIELRFPFHFKLPWNENTAPLPPICYCFLYNWQRFLYNIFPRNISNVDYSIHEWKTYEEFICLFHSLSQPIQISFRYHHFDLFPSSYVIQSFVVIFKIDNLKII